MGSGGETPRHQKRWEVGVDEWRPPETEQECLDYYQERIANSHARQLLPLQEDLAEWLNKTLGLNYITASNFIDVLDNGAILCHLAQIIQEKANEAIKSGTAGFNGPVPVIKGPFFEKASRKSFFSRDNTEKFIQFCKQLGVHQNLLFETNDLVQQNKPRNVILCLMEVARIASRFNVEPPGLVALEKEIAEEESRELRDWQFQTIHRPSFSSSENALCTEPSKNIFIQEGGCGVGEVLRRVASERIPASVGNSEPDVTDDWSRSSTEEPLENELPEAGLNDLDVKVKYVTKAALRQCRCIGSKCDKLKVRKVGEGRYNIFGRNVFVRLLKGRHMMVRVGGGWDTLEHFMQRHDPCQGRIGSRPSTPAAGKGQRPYSALNSYDVHSALHTPHSLGR
ncbi:unnamed protein product [Nezara viridula]|uniref:Growth arrest-specific protein 2 n=1 Tax=Nezara viridula TaxID=85310 RepID=A0A9P0E779_NEZVI|nr:unnamed protein product [Nezara viridula]